MSHQSGMEAGPSNPYPDQVVYCKWDYCSEIFATFAEWDQHLVVDHMAYERAVDMKGRKVRRRADGVKELVDEEFNLQHELPLQSIDPDTTTTTTTTHTLSHPLPPSFQSLPDPPTQTQTQTQPHSSSMPTNLILPPRSSPEHELDDEPISTGQSYGGIFQEYMGSRTPSPSPSFSHTSSPRTGAQAEMLPPAEIPPTAHHSPSPSLSHGRNASTRRNQIGPSGNAHTSFFSPINSDFSGIQSVPLSQSHEPSTPSSSLNTQTQSTGSGSSSALDAPQGPIESPPRVDQSPSHQYNTPSQSGVSLAFGAALVGDDDQASGMGVGTQTTNGSPLALANRTGPTTRGGGRGRKSSFEGVGWQWGAGF